MRLHCLAILSLAVHLTRCGVVNMRRVIAVHMVDHGNSLGSWRGSRPGAVRSTGWRVRGRLRRRLRPSIVRNRLRYFYVGCRCTGRRCNDWWSGHFS